MRCKRTVKIIIDIAMYLIFVALMQEHLWSDGLHEWLGITLFALFIAHTILNFRWYQSLFKGKYTPARTTSAIIKIALLAAMLCCMVSSVLVSGKVFAFLNLGGARFGRTLHLVSTAWAFVLMSLHLGLHLTSLTNKLKKNKKLLRAGQILAVLLAAYGVYVFIDRAFYEELFYLTEFKFFDTDKSAVLYFFETVAMSFPFAFITYYGRKLLQMKKNKMKIQGGTMNKLLKSILSLVLCIGCVFALAACGQQNNTTTDNTDTAVSNNTVADNNTDDSADSTSEESTAGDSNILVAYFSWSGNTQQVANWISDKTGGELFRITPEVDYTEDDVFDRAQDELNSGTRPPLSSHIDSETMAEYDVIFVGFPIWWYDLPMPVWSFLEESDLSGKTIIPFFTHNGSSSGASSISTVAELCPDSTVLTDDYFTYSGNNVDEAESDVDEWLTELGYKN